MCDQTLDSAEKNAPPEYSSDQFVNLDGAKISRSLYFRFWRCRLIVKSYFYLGKLEEGLAWMEKQEKALPNG